MWMWGRLLDNDVVDDDYDDDGVADVLFVFCVEFVAFDVQGNSFRLFRL